MGKEEFMKFLYPEPNQKKIIKRFAWFPLYIERYGYVWLERVEETWMWNSFTSIYTNRPNGWELISREPLSSKQK